MNRQQSRARSMEFKKRIEKMSVGEFEEYLNGIVRNTRIDMAEHFRAELHERYGFKKRWADVIIGVMERIVESDKAAQEERAD